MFISQPCEVRREAAIFEKKVGKGRLLVSTCVYNQNNPSCVALMDGMVKYMQSGNFQPASELPVSVLMQLINSSRSLASSGPAAQTDISHKPEESKKLWHNKAVTVEIPQGGWVSVNNGKWVQKRNVTISSEGTAKVFIRKTEKDTQPEIKEVCIDMTPPVITFSAEPPLEQEGGVYFGTDKTQFAFNVSEPLSGIQSIEFATDGNGNRLKPYTGSFKLSSGNYGIRCRVTDNAGNVSEIMGGDILSGGSADVVVLNIKK